MAPPTALLSAPRTGAVLRAGFVALAAVVVAVTAGLSAAGRPGAALARATLGPRPDAAPDETTTLLMGRRESLSAALRRAGVAAGDADAASSALADDFDVVNPHPGLALRLATTRGRLRGLGVTPRSDETLTLQAGADGRWRIGRTARDVAARRFSLARGVVHGSLYLSLIEAGAAPDQASAIADGFGRRLDLSRDIDSGDRIRLLFEHSADTATLTYAEVTSRSGIVRLYRDSAPGAPPRWRDGEAAPSSSGLLRTPVAGARVTSGFGLRLHPLLGFTRMHQGVDFGASVGAPVLAAGDGVVEEARWAGGYGRWLRIRHGATIETGYGHLSAWAPGIRPGARVRQGDVVAYVGDSGLATGPHLHFEVLDDGRRIDPRAAPSQAFAGAAPDPMFRGRRAAIDSQVATLAG